MPPIPPPEGLHPLVVHFPIAVFLIALTPLAFAAVFRRHAGAWAWTSVLLLTIATAGAFAAVITGETAEDALGPISAAAEAAVHRHEESAEMVRNLMPVTLAFAVVLAVLLSMHKRDPRLIVPASLALLASWSFTSIRLADAAHEGGVLVHVHGLHAPVASAATGAVGTPPDPGRRPIRDDDDD